MTSRVSALGLWVWIAIAVSATTVFVCDASRFMPPPGERFVNYLPPGGGDLIPSYVAAAALLDGQNPYHSKIS